MLTEAKIKELQTGPRLRKILDSDNLFLFVQPTGTLTWRMRYKYAGKDRTFTLGQYPAIKLAEARNQRNEAIVKLQRGEDPFVKVSTRKQQAVEAQKAAANTFRAVAEEYWANHSKGLSDATKLRDERIQQEVYALIGDRPIKQIDRNEVHVALKTIAASGRGETTHRAFGFIHRVFLEALNDPALGLTADPTYGLNKKLPKVVEKKHAAITNAKEFGQLLRAIDGYTGEPATVAALKLLPLVFTRYGELRLARWNEIDPETEQWVIPAERMKTRSHDHIVPLSKQALAILKWLHPQTGAGQPENAYVFPANRPGRPLSENTVGGALRALGYTGDQHVAHGFRTSASSLLHERGFDSAVIELQLAHTDGNKVRAVYNRSARLEDRRKLMQAWADYCDELRNGATIVQLRKWQ